MKKINNKKVICVSIIVLMGLFIVLTISYKYLMVKHNPCILNHSSHNWITVEETNYAKSDTCKRITNFYNVSRIVLAIEQIIMIFGIPILILCLEFKKNNMIKPIIKALIYILFIFIFSYIVNIIIMH